MFVCRESSMIVSERRRRRHIVVYELRVFFLIGPVVFAAARELDEKGHAWKSIKNTSAYLFRIFVRMIKSILICTHTYLNDDNIYLRGVQVFQNF